MDLSEYRTKIDEIDRQLVSLFAERMAEHKKATDGHRRL